MKVIKLLAVLVGLPALLWLPARAQNSPLVRVPNTSLKLPAVPESFGYATERAFGSLSFIDPLAIVVPPGETNRLFVVEQEGTIAVITNLAQPTRSVFLDIEVPVVSGGEQGLLGLAFHPGYATNRQFYIFYTLNSATAAGSGLHDRLSQFLVRENDPNEADPDSELVLIDQYDQAANHNGGDLHFGPDGYLYVALGDEGGGNDSHGNSQRIDRDFFAGILRIDVDRRPGNLDPNPHPANTNSVGGFAYSVPADNPFVGATSFNGLPLVSSRVRTEFWAVGLRNPWRMSFDRDTGRLYCGDVGQERFEEIDIIERGGNYGWSYREGLVAGPRGNPPAGVTFQSPILVYSHGNATNQGFSVTGGVVNRGERLSGLYGAYIFADYVSGHIWATRYAGTTNPPFTRLLTDTEVAGFDIDPRNGDVLLADRNQDTIKRLVHSSTPVGDPLPPTLAETGVFKDLVTLEPEAGVVPYDLNMPFWSDGAEKQRWFSLPNTNLTFGFSELANWFLPTGAVWIKHFSLPLTNGVPESTRRLETRFVVRNALGAWSHLSLG
jgi:glucose/arabinose dehydrogenase